MRRGHKWPQAALVPNVYDPHIVRSVGPEIELKHGYCSSDTLACSCEVLRPLQPSPFPHRKTFKRLHILFRLTPLLAPPRFSRCLDLAFFHVNFPLTSPSDRIPSSRPSW